MRARPRNLKAGGAAKCKVPLPLLLLIVGSSALTLHVARYWRPLAFAASVVVTLVLMWAALTVTTNGLEFFGISFALQPLARDYLLVALAISGVLAIATSFGDVRRTLGFLLWSWIVWLVVLLVGDFVLGVFAWALGLAVIVIAMEPRHAQRTGGAAYFLVLIVIASALLLIGHRFVQLYPLTPDRLELVDNAVLFLTWGLGLLLAIAPFILWLGPMADETSPPIIAILLGLGLPLGLWLLYGLIGQYPRLLEQSDLLAILVMGGLGSVLVGGALCVFERRAGRLMSYAALFALGFVLLDLARGTLEGTAFAVIELFARAASLCLMAAALVIARAVQNRWVGYLALFVFLLGGLNLTGLVPGVALVTRWNLFLEYEATDRRIFFLLLLATMGVVIGLACYTRHWLASIAEPIAVQDKLSPVPPPASLSGRLRFRLKTIAFAWSQFFAQRIPPPVRQIWRGITNHWRALFSAVLLVLLGAFLLWYNVSPNLWLQRALETVAQLTFMR